MVPDFSFLNLVRVVAILGLPSLLGGIWAVVAARTGKRKAVYAGLAGGLAGAIVFAALCSEQLPPLGFVLVCASVGAISGALAGLIIGLPLGLIWLFSRHNLRRTRASPSIPANYPESGLHVPQGDSIAAKPRDRAPLRPVALSAILVVVFVPCCIWIVHVTMKGWLPLPPLDDVAGMTASFNDPSRGPNSEVAQFEVPLTCRPDIYSSLRPAYEDLDFPIRKWVFLGHLHIMTKAGEAYDVDLYDLDAGEAGAFSVPPSTIYYRGGSSEALKAALWNAYAQHEKERRR